MYELKEKIDKQLVRHPITLGAAGEFHFDLPPEVASDQTKCRQLLDWYSVDGNHIEVEICQKPDRSYLSIKRKHGV